MTGFQNHNSAAIEQEFESGVDVQGQLRNLQNCVGALVVGDVGVELLEILYLLDRDPNLFPLVGSAVVEFVSGDLGLGLIVREWEAVSGVLGRFID